MKLIKKYPKVVKLLYISLIMLIKAKLYNINLKFLKKLNMVKIINRF